jgi:hypothetical protein
VRVAVSNRVGFMPSTYNKNAVNILLALGFLTFLTSVCFPAVITFDDLSDAGNGTRITSYQGFNWVSIDVLNATQNATLYGTNGFYYGMVSAPNIAAASTHASVSSPTNFDFLSVCLTGAWKSNLNIAVIGIRGGEGIVYSRTVIVSATEPTLFTFNYLNIDSLVFSSFGGQPAFGTSTSDRFAMDNFTFEVIPEPASFLLTAAGALLLWPLFKRKRA